MPSSGDIKNSNEWIGWWLHIHFSPTFNSVILKYAEASLEWTSLACVDSSFHSLEKKLRISPLALLPIWDLWVRVVKGVALWSNNSSWMIYSILWGFIEVWLKNTGNDLQRCGQIWFVQVGFLYSVLYSDYPNKQVQTLKLMAICWNPHKTMCTFRIFYSFKKSWKHTGEISLILAQFKMCFQNKI